MNTHLFFDLFFVDKCFFCFAYHTQSIHLSLNTFHIKGTNVSDVKKKKILVFAFLFMKK